MEGTMPDSERLDYKNRIADLEAELRKVTEERDYLKRKLFGTSSEKIRMDDFPGQISLFDEAEVYAAPAAPEPSMEDVKGYHRRKHEGQKEELIKGLHHTKKLCTLAEEDRFCPVCGSPLYPVGEEFLRSEVVFIPAKLEVIDYYRETYECRNCRKAGKPYFEKSPAPYPPVQHSLASPSTIAWCIHQKYELAVPMYRQEQEWKAAGLEISRATLCNWVTRTYRDWFSHVVERLKEELFHQNYLHIDETPVQVLNEAGRANTTKSFMWVYASIREAEHRVRLFDYRPGRSGKYPKEMLKDFHGYIHTDAYSGYNNIDGVTRCFCWVHLRRNFYDALPKDLEDPSSTKPAIALRYISRLFEIEGKISNLSPEGRKAARQDQEKPVLDAFFAWVEDASAGVLPKSKLGEAFLYVQNQKEGLLTYLEDGHCSISNQLAENSIRPFTIGRKNWLFSGSPKGAEASAGMYTLIETAKANGLQPMKYIQYILEDMPGTAFLQYPEYLEDYLPWNPDIQKHCR